MFDKKAQIKVVTSTKDHKFELAELEPLIFSECGQNINFPNREIKKSIKIDDSQKFHKILGIGYSFEHTSCQK